MIKVVTDSTADLPPEVARSLGITVVPLYVHFGDEVFRDGVDLSADEFYHRLQASPRPPTTSAPSPGVFSQVYQSLSAPGDDILSLHISARLSATYQAALQGSQQAPECRVTVVDSENVSLGLGLLAFRAAQLSAQGQGLEQIVGNIHRCIPRVQLFGVLDTLEYLQKGGRIGKAQAFLGTLLHIKPILGVKDGEVHPLERVRSRSKGLERICELVQQGGEIEMMAVLHSTTPAEAEELAQRLSPLLPQGQILRGRFGPVLGTHVGPGVLGVALLRKGEG